MDSSIKFGFGIGMSRLSDIIALVVLSYVIYTYGYRKGTKDTLDKFCTHSDNIECVEPKQEK